MSELEIKKKELRNRLRKQAKVFEDTQLELDGLEKLKDISIEELRNGAIELFSYKKENKTFRNNMFGFNQSETEPTYDKEIVIVSTNGYYLDDECREAVNLYARAKCGIGLGVYFDYE